MADKPAELTALCPVCGVARFVATGESSEVLTCQSCGLKLSYAFLQSRVEQPVAAAKPASGKARKSTKRRKRAAKARKRR